MRLPDFAIRRPVFIVVQVLAVLVLGLAAYRKLGVDLMPNVEFPFVVVSTVYAGASAAEVETDVSKKLEDKLSSVAGLDEMWSYSNEGYSVVVLKFKLEVDPRRAEADARTKVEQTLSDLPTDIEKPVVSRVDWGAEPVIAFALGGDLPLAELRRLADKEIKPQIEKIDGVAEVDVEGGLEREVKVEVDPAALAGYGVSLDEVSYAVAAANLDVPAGPMRTAAREEKLRVAGKFASQADVENVVVARVEGKPIYLRDVARADVNDYKERKTLTKLDGKDSVTIAARKASGANTVALCDAVLTRLDDVKKTLPPGVTVRVAYNDADIIKSSVRDTTQALYLGAIFAVVVILFFLGNLRTTVISALAIPTSILFTFLLMQAVGFTLNMMTLMALSLAVGILIDDAIVVRENIYRHWEEGMSLDESASFGTAEVGLAVVATTLTIAAVFVPVANMTGMVGRFFRSFGLVVVFAVAYSLWDALTMAPMLSAKLHIGSPDPNRKSRFERFFLPVNRLFEQMAAGYRTVLAYALRRRGLVLALAGVLFCASLVLTRFISTSFMPRWDRGVVYVFIQTPLDSSLGHTETVADEVSAWVGKYREVETVFTTVGVSEIPNRALVTLRLKPRRERARSDIDLQEELRTRFRTYPKARVSVLTPEMGGVDAERGEQPLSLEIQGPDLDRLQEIAAAMVKEFATYGGARDVGSSYEPGKPEVRLIPDRAMCTELGIPVSQVALTMRGLVEGTVATKYAEAGEEYDVRVMMPRRNLRTLADVEGLHLKDRDGNMVPLAMLVKPERAAGATQIEHHDRIRSVTVWMGKGPRVAQGDLQKKLAAYSESHPLPAGYAYNEGFNAQLQREMFESMFTALAIAVIFVYIVLAAQFNSFLHPFTIMLALPLAIVGALLAIFILGTTFDMMTMVGLILLIGIVNKNAILLVDYALQKIKEGASVTDALLKAGPIRMRPILMTTAAMIMGMLPTALGLGEGGEFRQGMAVAVIGGLITSTFLTLIVVPVVFSYVEAMRRRRGAAKVEAGEPA